MSKKGQCIQNDLESFCHDDWSKAAKISLSFHYYTCLCLGKWKKDLLLAIVFWDTVGLFEGTPQPHLVFFEVGYLGNKRVHCNFLLLCTLRK